MKADGKINGRGATYQNLAQGAFLAGFRDDVCGATANTPADPAADMMGVYNYPTAVSGGFTGSGAGLKAANCRTDAYVGSDLPYSEAQLVGLNGNPGNATIGGCATFPAQPFAPNGGGPFPAGGDQATPIMSYPVAGAAVALAINLKATDCTSGVKPSGLAFTSAQVSAIFGGSVARWNDASLTGNNPSLSTCNVAITRVVRFDSSGTTGIFKNYLIRVDDARTAATCAPGTPTTNTWTSFNVPDNRVWPSGAGCNGLTTSGANGGPSLVTKLGTVSGGVGYADLADEVVGVSGSGLITASVRNGTNTAFASPVSGSASNCEYSSLTLPGSSSGDAVGLNTSDNWGNDNAAVNGSTGAIDHINATNLGQKYPICGITFALVYSNLGANAAPNAIAALSADQRRTLYSYETYILSSTAQGKLGNIYYAPLPALWIPTLLDGFQSNY